MGGIATIILCGIIVNYTIGVAFCRKVGFFKKNISKKPFKYKLKNLLTKNGIIKKVHFQNDHYFIKLCNNIKKIKVNTIWLFKVLCYQGTQPLVFINIYVII